jgi:hypothetical protein
VNSDEESRDRMTIGDFEGNEDGVLEGETDTATVERRLRQRKYTQEIRSLTGSLDRRMGQYWKLHAEAAASSATDKTPDAIADARFTNLEGFDGIGFTNPRTPHLIAPAGVADAANYELDSFALERASAKDTTRQLRLDLQRDFDAGDWNGAVKFGAKTTRRDKKTDTEAWEYGSDDPTDDDYFGAGPTSMSAFVNGTRLDYPFANLGYAIDPALVRARQIGRWTTSGCRKTSTLRTCKRACAAAPGRCWPAYAPSARALRPTARKWPTTSSRRAPPAALTRTGCRACTCVSMSTRPPACAPRGATRSCAPTSRSWRRA